MQVEDKRVEKRVLLKSLVVKKQSLQTHNKYQSSLSTSIKLFPPITCIFIDTQNAYLFFVIFMNTILLSYV